MLKRARVLGRSRLRWGVHAINCQSKSLLLMLLHSFLKCFPAQKTYWFFLWLHCGGVALTRSLNWEKMFVTSRLECAFVAYDYDLHVRSANSRNFPSQCPSRAYCVIFQVLKRIRCTNSHWSFNGRWTHRTTGRQPLEHSQEQKT